MSRILIIEDNDEINDLVKEVFENAGHETVSAYSGPEGLRLFEECNADLVVMDLMLPGMSGEKILPAIREKSAVPVIVMSAKTDVEGKVELLGNGADDYITKPFDTRELLARAELQLKKKAAGTGCVIEHGEIKIYTNERKVMVKDTEITLTRHEYDILEILAKHPNKVFGKQELYEQAWDEYYVGEDKTINVHISNIRKKIKEVTDVEYIDTVWGIGFKLK